MDTRLKEIVDNFDKMKIDLDETFRFHCTMCGKCCIHREDILLTPKDVYSIAKELGISPQEMIEQYCETYIGGDSKMPIVRLRPCGSVRRCPLLKDRKCMVHKAKPAVCAMFPIGRALMVKAGQLSGEMITADQVQYILNDPGCGDDAETHTVREWLDSFGIPTEDAFFVKWQTAVIELSCIFGKAVEVASATVMRAAWSLTFAGLYLNYDMGQDFMPQFEENMQNVLTAMHALPVDKGGEENDGRPEH